MSIIAKRLLALEQAMASIIPVARIYDYRDQSDEAWFQHCAEMKKGMSKILMQLGDGRPSSEDDRLMEKFEKFVNDLMRKPREQRYE